MGVKRELIPANADEADELGNLIFNQQIEYSEEGEVLADALLEFLHEFMPGKHGTTPEIMMHFFLGEEVSQAVGLKVRPSLWEWILEWLLKHIFKHKDKRYKHIPNIVKLGDKLKMKFLQASVNHVNDGKQVDFFIPPGLKDDWGI